MNGCILLNSNGIVSHRNSRNHGCILHSPSRYGTSRHGQGTLAATSIFLRKFPCSPTFIIWFLDHAFVVKLFSNVGQSTLAVRPSVRSHSVAKRNWNSRLLRAPGLIIPLREQHSSGLFTIMKDPFHSTVDRFLHYRRFPTSMYLADESNAAMYSSPVIGNLKQLTDRLPYTTATFVQDSPASSLHSTSA